MSVRRKVELDPVAIQKMFVRGGDIYQFAAKTSDDIRDAARRRVRNRSRRLWRSISSRGHSLPLGVSFKVQAFAPHALWVEEGTASAGTWFIGVGRPPDKPMVLYAGARFVPAKYARYSYVRMDIVAGQKPRHYLRNGLRAGLLRNNLRP